MSIAFNSTDPVPRWRVGVFVSSSRRPRHVVMVAVGDAEIAAYGKHPDFVRWLSPHQFKVGDRVRFRHGYGPALPLGVEHVIFALGDRAGTFDLHQPGVPTADRWRNVPPEAMEPADGVMEGSDT